MVQTIAMVMTVATCSCTHVCMYMLHLSMALICDRSWPDERAIYNACARHARVNFDSRRRFKLMIFMKLLVLLLLLECIAGIVLDPLSRYRKPHPYSSLRERV